MAQGSERIPPNSSRMLEFLRAVGYSLEAAVADLIDNSIQANAKNVLVRIWRSESTLERFVIVDDGDGIAPDEMRRAMQFAGGGEREPDQLGKFGMGLKLASLSQAKELTVVTRSSGAISGRRWTTEGIADDWRCDVVADADISSLLSENTDPVVVHKHGTLVEWADLDRVDPGDSVDGAIEHIMKRLRLHLGMHFHRFIEDGRVKLWLDTQRKGKSITKTQSEVAPLNPFDYGVSGHADFPKTYQVSLGRGQSLEVEGHIWPAQAVKSPGYRLDGKVAARQGLYIYRNDRLIQAGGWNDGRDSEPHSSLARAIVNLPASLDSQFALDVKKASVKVPPTFKTALGQGRAKDGTTFSNFTTTANKVYRKHERADPRNYPLIPSKGLSHRVREKVKDILLPKGGKVRPVSIEWGDVESGGFFEIDRDNLQITLNRAFRKKLLTAQSASSADLPVVKLLTFLLLEETLDSGRMSAQQRDRFESCSRALAFAAQAIRDSDD